MVRNRVIPSLLLDGRGLVKTVRFGDSKYVGDPINAVKIFNDKEVDELILIDINASEQGVEPQFDLISSIASECFMPICYGGGVRSLADIDRLFEIGIEKVALNKTARLKPELVREAAAKYGEQSIIGVMDIKKGFLGKHSVYGDRGKLKLSLSPVDYAKYLESCGVGEILVNSINQDGTCSGYDLDVISQIASAVKVPVVALGGAGKLDDLKDVVKAGASAAAAGSLFVFHGKHKAVLISYPDRKTLDRLFEK